MSGVGGVRDLPGEGCWRMRAVWGNDGCWGVRVIMVRGIRGEGCWGSERYWGLG